MPHRRFFIEMTPGMEHCGVDIRRWKDMNLIAWYREDREKPGEYMLVDFSVGVGRYYGPDVILRRLKEMGLSRWYITKFAKMAASCHLGRDHG